MAEKSVSAKRARSPERFDKTKFTIARARWRTREARVSPDRSAAIPLAKGLVATVVGVERCRG